MIDYKNASIVDVRSRAEFEGGAVEGSINIPVDEIQSRLNDLRDLKMPIVLCCASGGRSGTATMVLQANGFTEVYNGGSWFDVASKL